jgi:hypothetical protein
MKRWAILTVFLYALALILLTMPAVLAAFGDWGFKNDSISLADAAKIYALWRYWIWLAVLAGGQFLLLLLPINIAERRLPARRPLKIPVIVTAFFLANLLFAGIFSILCAIFTDGAFMYFDVTLLFHHGADQQNNSGDGAGFTMIATTIVFWIVWGIIFRRATKSDEPDALVKRITRWLLRGSILELIIAVPSHVIVRRRDDCCAPAGTFWGIATGISVMLLCFGPGVFYLFAERIGKMKPKPHASESKQG